MERYAFFNIPKSCEVNNTIFKKLFYENGDLSTADKKLLTEGIGKITWLYCLKPDTINIRPYQDETREYNEIEVLEVSLVNLSKIERLAEIIMRTIPYPMVLIFRFQEQWSIWTAHQRKSLKDETKNALEAFVHTNWLVDTKRLEDRLDIKKMNFANFYSLYNDMVDQISILNLNGMLTKDSIIMTGEEARKITIELNSLEQEITRNMAMLKNESQFNSKLKLNRKIKQCENRKDQLLEEIINARS